ncbi:hypothetical protein HNQ85_001764 [Anoxybacillus calidus]|jgi:uncharacterized protein|uniref:DUF2225 domain-containing protein n=1 Tax=[Anoxybacillus] calidus TaxID=575178 RepID=A0A7W0BWY2_9BACL|nr:DUF2225 domain-containing protein [Anoxybacillus calidus]MBA2871494.1 hypothetical protein [Anoxybacillus calidus]
MKHLEPLYDRKIKCLVCKNVYTTKKIRSRFIRAIQHDTDFCSYYHPEELNPLFYYVSVCPHCGFSATEEFSTYFPPSTLETIQKKICEPWSGFDYGGQRTFQEAVNTYKLGIYSATLKREKHIAMAGLYMRLAWLYRTYQIIDQEERFMRLALQEYISSYSEEDFIYTHMSEVRLLYLIGELNRRLGNDKEAILYFSKVIAKRKETIERRIAEMAYERWQEIREQQKLVQNRG